MANQLVVLNLTEDQKSKIKAIINKHQPDIEKLRSSAQGGGDRTTLRSQMRDLSQKMRDEVKAVLTADQQKQLNGLSDGTLSFSVEFSNVGQPQTITAPTSSKPITDLTSKLGSLSGALGGATGGSSGSGSSGGASTQALQKYSKCLQKANPTNTAQLQKCADLLK